MTYNLPLLRKERDWVAEQKSLPYSESQLAMDYWYVPDTSETHDLAEKTCGTAYCVAGHIAATTPGVEWNGPSVTLNGAHIDISAWARKQLGLNHQEAFELFYSSDDDVLDVLDDLIDKAEIEERKDAS